MCLSLHVFGSVGINDFDFCKLPVVKNAQQTLAQKERSTPQELIFLLNMYSQKARKPERSLVTKDDIKNRLKFVGDFVTYKT